MRTGPGWYLFRCPKCRQAFVDTNLAEYCDCGNTDWEEIGPFKKTSKGRIRVEMDLGKAEGCIVVWDHEQVRDSGKARDSKEVRTDRRVGIGKAAGRFFQWVMRVGMVR